jgi:hypothetical protein
MPQKRLFQIARELPLRKKLIIAGSVLLAASLFFRWYQDFDFETGQSFTGLTGPLYLVGFTFLVIASLCLVFTVMDYFNKKITLFKIKTSKLYLVLGIFTFYLLLVVGSVYFDFNFGINLNKKMAGTGMFMAYIAAALITLGGYLEMRGINPLREFKEETREPELKIPVVEQKKPVENLRRDTVQPQEEKTPQTFRTDL